jgi:activator of Hsp90 ATPase-like protein
VPAAQYGMSADIPLEMLVTVTFEEHERKTTLTLLHFGITAGAERDGAYVGWNHLWTSSLRHSEPSAPSGSKCLSNYGTGLNFYNDFTPILTRSLC